MLKRTPLHDAHVALGARLVDFAGWRMPLHYGSQLDEHQRVRRDTGVFDVSHMLALEASGTGARSFLRMALANDVDRLETPGKALYSCLLNESGGIVDDLIVYRIGASHYRLVVNAATAETDIAWLEALRARSSADTTLVALRGLCLLAVQGPASRECAARAIPALRDACARLARFHAAQCGDVFVSRTGYTGEDGVELMLSPALAAPVWEALLRAGAAPCGLGARDTLRLEAGLNLYGQDMDESVTPAESGLAWTVDSSPGREFIGRQALEREVPRRRLAGLVLIERGVMRAHARVLTPHGEGHTTSGGFAPTIGASIALARVPAALAAGETVRVEVRGRLLEARVVAPPFVRYGRILTQPSRERQ